MPYAEGRRYYDADSHVMEPTDWLVPYADPSIRDRLRPALGSSDFTRAKAEEILAQRDADPEKRARAEARLLAAGYQAYGSWDPGERSRALDVLGFDAQLVFSTFSTNQYAGDDLDLLYGGTRAQNRALVDFCAHDERLIAVGYVPMDDPDRAAVEVKEAIKLGCGAVLVPSAYKEKSPTHPDYEPVWGQLADAGIPFMLHIGTGGRLVPRAYRNNGRPVPPDFLGGGENIRSKDYLGIPFWPQYFLQVMALDGVFERFPGLRGGCIEQGAEWIVTGLRQVDHAQDFFKKGEPDLQTLPGRASDYIRRKVKFTPFPKEDVGWIIEQVGPELLLFSSDYPHIEGGHDPLKNFEASLSSVSDDAKERFYSGNFAEMMGSAVPA